MSAVSITVKSAVFVAALLLSIDAQPGTGTESSRSQGERTAGDSAAPAASFDALKGRWRRTDGGYMIAIRAVAADGALDAAYANPRPLPFAVAQARRQGGSLSVFLELRAGGYEGSTYNLVYDPARDVLKGVYYQAVARQRFDVEFARAP